MSFTILNFQSIFTVIQQCFLLLLIAALLKLYRKRVHINSSLADDYFLPNEEDNKPEDKCDGIIQGSILVPIFQTACIFSFSFDYKIFGSLLESYLYVFYTAFIIASIFMFVMSYRDYKKSSTIKCFFGRTKLQKVEKYIKIQPITFSLFLASAVLIFAF